MIDEVRQSELRLWLSRQLDMALPHNAHCIGQIKEGHIAGVVGFCHHINKSILIHSAGLYKSWVTRALLKRTFEYPFKDLGVNVLIGQVSSANQDAQRFNAHLGFKTALIIPDAHEDGDLVIMTMFKNECRYLEKEMEIAA